MKNARIYATIGLAVLGLGALSGCCGALEKQVEMLNLRISELQLENDGLTEQLGMCAADKEALQARNVELEIDLKNCLSTPSEPAPETPQIGDWKTQGDIAWTNLAQEILFDAGRHSLKASGRAKMQEIAQQLKSNFAGRDIYIIGHTDSDPIRATKDKYKDNLDLSQERAGSVFRELMKLGLNPKHMVAGGQGEYNPVVPDKGNRAAKAKNRRVTIIAIRKPDTE